MAPKFSDLRPHPYGGASRFYWHRENPTDDWQIVRVMGSTWPDGSPPSMSVADPCLVDVTTLDDYGASGEWIPLPFPDEAAGDPTCDELTREGQELGLDY